MYPSISTISDSYRSEQKIYEQSLPESETVFCFLQTTWFHTICWILHCGTVIFTIVFSPPWKTPLFFQVCTKNDFSERRVVWPLQIKIAFSCILSYNQKAIQSIFYYLLPLSTLPFPTIPGTRSRSGSDVHSPSYYEVIQTATKSNTSHLSCDIRKW